MAFSLFAPSLAGHASGACNWPAHADWTMI